MILSGRVSLSEPDAPARDIAEPSLARRTGEPMLEPDVTARDVAAGASERPYRTLAGASGSNAREQTMLEVEMKFPVTDFADVESRLTASGARLNCDRRDIDHYFNAPDRDFARSDEA